MAAARRPLWAAVLGPPASEARLLATLLSTRAGVPLLSVFNLARVERTHRTHVGRQLEQMQPGQLWPPNVVGQMVQGPLQRAAQTGTGIIASNFPKDMSQWKMLRTFAPALHVISLVGTREMLDSRVQQRRVCAACDAPMYPPLDAAVKAAVDAANNEQAAMPSSSRKLYTHLVESGCMEAAPVSLADDEGAALASRWSIYERQTLPLLAELRDKKLTRITEVQISADLEETWQRILQACQIADS